MNFIPSIVPVYDIWDFFIEHFDELGKKFLLVASFPEDGLNIYITEENGLPYFSVDLDGKTEHEVSTTSRAGAENTYRNLLNLFLEESDPEEVDEVLSNEQLDRVEEILCAVEDLLTVLLECHPDEVGIEDGDLDDIASSIEELLFDEYKCSIRHPTEVDGEVVEYPFGEVEDED